MIPDNFLPAGVFEAEGGVNRRRASVGISGTLGLLSTTSHFGASVREREPRAMMKGKNNNTKKTDGDVLSGNCRERFYY